MSNLLELIYNFFSSVGSALIALTRFFFLLMALTASGVHIILFTRTEICNVEMRGQAWRCDREKMMDQLSFVDKVCLENPDLLGFADEQMNKDRDLPTAFDDDEDDDEGDSSI